MLIAEQTTIAVRCEGVLKRAIQLTAIDAGGFLNSCKRLAAHVPFDRIPPRFKHCAFDRIEIGVRDGRPRRQIDLL